jgi:hypothetical protein
MSAQHHLSAADDPRVTPRPGEPEAGEPTALAFVMDDETESNESFEQELEARASRLLELPLEEALVL